MRMRALMGGAAVIGALAYFHPRPMATTRKAASVDAQCRERVDDLFCSSVDQLAKALRRGELQIGAAGRLPPVEVTGAIDPAITQANIGQTICMPGYSRSVRPPYSVTGPLKRRMMAAQHPGEQMADYELDHLIPISLGGAPLDRRDLWLQPRHGQANAEDKNVLAFVLWRLVCEGHLALATAQDAIRRDWIQAYQTYATPEDVARYHVRRRPDPAS
jgi:hypothetical protein